MKKIRPFFNESRDQAVPFALPALKSYKQNILFPEDAKQMKGMDLPLSDIPEEEIRPQSKVSNFRGRSQPSSTPRQGLSPIRPPKKPQSNNPISKKPSVPMKKPSLHRPTEDSQQKSLDRSQKLPTRVKMPLPKPQSTLGKFPHILEEPFKPSKPMKPLTKPPSQFDNQKSFEEPTQPLRSSTRTPTKIIPKKPIKPMSARPLMNKIDSEIRHKTPMSVRGHNNGNKSISSIKSLGQPRFTNTPLANIISSKNGVNENTYKSDLMQEQNDIRNQRNSAARSVSRKRPKKKKGHSFFDFDIGPFKMSDLSIYPLL
ncbi:hypothetical protein SteCoe_3481 [Stentor coeruleus]|uniref:Uncharacterized protein n=1 Tax=Stentor coeruleus TaxID=5963 RepID=A0A1R2CWW9_9CILI|nr:hypothetical protein SteCoe_3481 [Stentor coeruleus]